MQITMNINNCFECLYYKSNEFHSSSMCEKTNILFESFENYLDIKTWRFGAPSFCPYKLYKGIGIVGKACSGKTTLANFIRQEISFKPPVILKFADPLYYYLNSIKQQKNRNFLIDLADLTKKYFGNNIFVEIMKDKILDRINTHFVIIDDVRFFKELEMLKKLDIFIIYLDIDDEIRKKRAETLGLPWVTDHLSESGVDSLKQYADYVITEEVTYNSKWVNNIYSGKFWLADY